MINLGWQWNAYEDVMTWGGVETEQEYPYTAVDGYCALSNNSIHYFSFYLFYMLQTRNC